MSEADETRDRAEAAAPGDLSGLEADYARCSQITREAHSSFYYAFMLMPAERRRALHAVYAFCRFIDDIADEHSVHEPGALLALWRAELERVFGGTPTRPVSRALADSARRFNLERRYFEELIDGVEMDLTRTRYHSFDELRLYCYRVASTVGLMCVEIFGYSNKHTLIYAENLGIAFQLTNILRDVSEDAARGRIYVPLEDLARFGVSQEEIFEGVHSDRFERLMEFEANRARSFYEAAQRALPDEDRQTLLTAEAMRLIYGALLQRIIRSNYRVLGRRHSLSAPRKLFLVGRAWASARLNIPRDQ